MNAATRMLLGIALLCFNVCAQEPQDIAFKASLEPSNQRVVLGELQRLQDRLAGLKSPNPDHLADARIFQNALRSIREAQSRINVLHGHDRIHSTMWFEGADRQIPAVGVPSASALAHRHYPAAAYNLFSIARDGEKWRCVQTVRAIDADFRVKQIKQATLL